MSFTALTLWSLFLFVLYFLGRFVVRPLRQMKYYSQFKGAVRLPFIPIVGAFASLKPAYDKCGDAQRPAKQTYKYFPDSKILITSFIDKALVLMNDPQMIKDFFLNKEKHYVKYDMLFLNKARIFGEGVAFSQGSDWNRRRKIMTSLFHFEFFQQFYPKIEKIVDKLLAEIEPGKSESAIGLGSRVAGEVILRCFFGQDIHQVKFKGMPLTVALTNLVGRNAEQDQTLWYMLFGPKFFDLGLRKIDREINHDIKAVRAIGREVITKLIKNNKDIKDTNFVKMAIDEGYLDGKGELYITTEQMIEEFFTFFIGGMDTTAHLMGMGLYYMAIHPQVQETLRKQINATTDLSLSALSKLPYLDAVVNETNRHYGFMTSFFPRIALKDHQLGDIPILKGTVVMPNWLGNYYAEKWYPNPDDFRPERWLDGLAKTLEQEYIFTPFSMGKRSCIGKKLATIETKLLFAKVLSKFKLRLKEGYVHKLVQRSLYEPENTIELYFEPV